MDVFDLDRRVVGDYQAFARSFTTIRAADIDARIKAEYASGRFWPEPILQVNPHFEAGETMAAMVADGLLHARTAAFFGQPGRPFQPFRHQAEAIRAAERGARRAG